MLTWASLGPLLRDKVASGRPKDFRFLFGEHKGKTLIQVLSEGNMSYVYWYMDKVTFTFPDHFMLFIDMKKYSGRLFKRKTFVPDVSGLVIIKEEFRPEVQTKWRAIKAAYLSFENSVLKPAMPREAVSDSSDDDMDINGHCTSHLNLLIAHIPFSARVLAPLIYLRALPSFSAQTIGTVLIGDIIQYSYQRVVNIPDVGAIKFLRLVDKGWVACTDESGTATVELQNSEAKTVDDMLSNSDASQDCISDSSSSGSEGSDSFRPNSDSDDDVDSLDSIPDKEALVSETRALKADLDMSIDTVLEEALNEAFPAFELHQQRQERSQNRIEKVLNAIPAAVTTPAELIAHCAAVFSGLHSDHDSASGVSSDENGCEGDDDCDSSASEDEYDPRNISALHSSVSPEQFSFVEAFLRQKPDLGAWSSPWIPAPDPRFRGSGLDPSNTASWLQTPSFMCSPSNQFQHLGVTQIPCAGCRDFGDDPFHDDVVLETSLRMRNVRGMSSDFCLVGHRARCKRCEGRRRSAKSSLRSALGTSESPSHIKEHKVALKKYRSGRFTTYDSDMLIILAERFPFLYNWVPGFVTHRSAVSSELLSFSV
jgi:hypothetical protein